MHTRTHVPHAHAHTHTHTHTEHVSDIEVPCYDWTDHFCRWQQNAEENCQCQAVSHSMTTIILHSLISRYLLFFKFIY